MKSVRPEPVEGPFMVRPAHHERYIADSLKRNNLPNPIAQNQFTIALQLPAQCRITEQIHHHRFTRRAKLCDLVAQSGIIERAPRETFGRAPAGQKFFVVRRAYA